MINAPSDASAGSMSRYFSSVPSKRALLIGIDIATACP
jgi:hypothetical protein